MSLKAKLEAVIYAAEEPVTLAQLAVLFVDDALQWKAEQEAATEAQDGEPTAAEAAALPLLNEAFPSLELELERRGGGSCVRFGADGRSDAGEQAPKRLARAQMRIPMRALKQMPLPARTMRRVPKRRRSARPGCATARPAS